MTASGTKPSSPSPRGDIDLGADRGGLIGLATHRVIADLVSADTRRPTAIELRRAVAGNVQLEHLQPSELAAGKQRVLAAVSVYVRFFAPDQDWKLIGNEVTAQGSRFDLVWERGDGIVVDELKSGRLTGPLERDEFEQQLERARENARTKYGPRFVGIRACVLAAPSQSFVVDRDGVRIPLEWGER